MVCSIHKMLVCDEILEWVLVWIIEKCLNDFIFFSFPVQGPENQSVDNQGIIADCLRLESHF